MTIALGVTAPATATHRLVSARRRRLSDCRNNDLGRPAIDLREQAMAWLEPNLSGERKHISMSKAVLEARSFDPDSHAISGNTCWSGLYGRSNCGGQRAHRLSKSLYGNPWSAARHRDRRG